MQWLHAADVGLLRFINETLSNSIFDVVMPLASGQGVKGLFLTIAIMGGVALVWKGGKRGFVCVLMLALIVPSCDGLICNVVKHAVARPRPFVILPELNRPGSKPRPGSSMPATAPAAGQAKPASTGSNNSMPSSHAANWFAATMVLFVYYRRSWKFTLPPALLVSFSRIYNGVHYPSDVLAGALIGAGYAVAALCALNLLWHKAGSRWSPRAWKSMPSLVEPDRDVRGTKLQPGSAASGPDVASSIQAP